MPHSKASPIFVYGTMMSPMMLSWILTGDAANHLRLYDYVQLLPARLYGYKRVPVKGSEYPALIPAPSTSAVDGLLVSRQTSNGFGRLDDFAADNYRRTSVQCHYIKRATKGEEAQGGKEGKDGKAVEVGWEVVARDRAVDADTYVWDGGCEKLDVDKDWSFEEFEKEKLIHCLDLFKGKKRMG